MCHTDDMVRWWRHAAHMFPSRGGVAVAVTDLMLRACVIKLFVLPFLQTSARVKLQHSSLYTIHHSLYTIHYSSMRSDREFAPSRVHLRRPKMYAAYTFNSFMCTLNNIGLNEHFQKTRNDCI